jgi:hypothetical protein
MYMYDNLVHSNLTVLEPSIPDYDILLFFILECGVSYWKYMCIHYLYYNCFYPYMIIWIVCMYVCFAHTHDKIFVTTAFLWENINNDTLNNFG